MHVGMIDPYRFPASRQRVKWYRDAETQLQDTMFSPSFTHNLGSWSEICFQTWKHWKKVYQLDLVDFLSSTRPLRNNLFPKHLHSSYFQAPTGDCFNRFQTAFHYFTSHSYSSSFSFLHVADLSFWSLFVSGLLVSS